MSGFQSMLEKNILFFLLKGKSEIILVLAKSKTVPKELEPAMNSGRLLIIFLEKDMVIRVSKQTALKRNKYIIDTCNELKFVGIDENSSIYGLL